MQELMIPLDSHQKVPLYQQIYRHIREEIGAVGGESGGQQEYGGSGI